MSQILPRLLANDVPAAPVLSRFELLQGWRSQSTGRTSEPEFGRVRQPRPAAQFDRTPARIRELAPLLGADNAAILGELGYNAEDIARLERERVIHKQLAHTPRK